jgi:hypothetical protein
VASLKNPARVRVAFVVSTVGSKGLRLAITENRKKSDAMQADMGRIHG